MAKFYIVAKEPNSSDYDLVKVNEGSSLAEIDLYTSNFKDKEDFLKYLQGQGLHASEDADLFIAYQKRDKSIEHLDLVYGYYKLKNFAESEINAKPNTTKCLEEIVKESKNNYDFQDLIRSNYFKMYQDVKNIILSSYRRDYIKYQIPEQWIRSDYRSGRDALAAIDEYYLIKDRLKQENKGKSKEKEIKIEERKEDLKKEKAKKELERRKVDSIIKMKMDTGPEQISLVGEQRSYIKLLYINGKMFGNEDLKKVVRKSKAGKMSKPPKLSIPTFENIEIDYTKHQEIGDLLRNLKFKKINTANGERYEVDFSKEKFNLSDEEVKYLNSLLKASLRKNSFLRQFYGNKKTEGSRRESRRYSSSTYNTIKNCAKKKDKFYDKAYRFYMIYNELSKDKQITLDDVLTVNEDSINAGYRR